MLRLGLCCIFQDQPIKFRRTTAKYLSRMPRHKQLDHLDGLCQHNAKALYQALEYCSSHGIGAFRINSQILPLKTHPLVGYHIESLPNYQQIKKEFIKCGNFSRMQNIRTSFHPDQFILLSSPNPEVTQNSIAELMYQAQVAEWVNADVINLHAGGSYGNKPKTLKRLRRRLQQLPYNLRLRLTLENDDKQYTPEDLLPICLEDKIPFVYDVHHHRCLPDGVNVSETTNLALKTWNREPLFHLSSPLNGWKGEKRFQHHDYIKIEDFPESWFDLDITVDVEAKAKELAVLKLRKEIAMAKQRGKRLLKSNSNVSLR